MDKQTLIESLIRLGYDGTLLQDVPESILAEMLRVADSAAQAADHDRDGEADSTQYAPVRQQPVMEEAQPPVESVKDGRPIPEEGFAEDEEPEPNAFQRRRLERLAPADAEDMQHRDEQGQNFKTGSRYLDDRGQQPLRREQIRRTGRVPGHLREGRDYDERDDSMRPGGGRPSGPNKGMPPAPRGASGDAQAIFQLLVKKGMDPRLAKQMAMQACSGGRGQDMGERCYDECEQGQQWMGEPNAFGLDPKRAAYESRRAATQALGVDGNDRLIRKAEQASKRGRYDHEDDYAEGESRRQGGSHRAAAAHHRDLEGFYDSDKGNRERPGIAQMAHRRGDAADEDYGREQAATHRSHANDRLRRAEGFDPGWYEQDMAEGDRDLGREERIRNRQRLRAGMQRGQMAGFGEASALRRHSERGEGMAMAQGASNGPALMERLTAQIIKKVEESLLPRLKAAAAEAEGKVEKFNEQIVLTAKAKLVDEVLDRVIMGEPRLEPSKRDLYKARGMAADDTKVIHKYSEGDKEVEVTAFKAWRDDLLSRPLLDLFNEKVGTDGLGNQGTAGDAEEKKVRANFQSFSEMWKKAGVKTADALVELFNVERKVRPDATADEYLTN